MEITVLEFLDKYSDLFHGSIYLKPFKGEIVKIEMSNLWEMLSLKMTNECAFQYEDIVVNDDADNIFLVIEDEITYLRRRVKEQALENKRLRDSLLYYHDALASNRQSTFDVVVHAFMPRGYSNFEGSNSTPLRRHIANVLFVMEKRGYVIPDDVKAFANRYKTKKTTRR